MSNIKNTSECHTARRKPHSHIENSYQLVHKLNGLSIEENYELIFWMLSRYLRIYLRIWHWKVIRTDWAR